MKVLSQFEIWHGANFGFVLTLYEIDFKPFEILAQFWLLGGILLAIRKSEVVQKLKSNDRILRNL